VTQLDFTGFRGHLLALPAESHSLFCTRLTRMIDTSIDMMGILIIEDRKRRGIADPR